MADRSAEQFAATLARLGRPAPWRVDTEHPGGVLDAAGGHPCVADQYGELTDAQALDLAAAIVTAVNNSAGFQAAGEGDTEHG